MDFQISALFKWIWDFKGLPWVDAYSPGIFIVVLVKIVKFFLNGTNLSNNYNCIIFELSSTSLLINDIFFFISFCLVVELNESEQHPCHGLDSILC